MDSLVPEDKKVVVQDVESVMKIINHSKVLSVRNLKDLSVNELKKLGNNAIITIYNFFGEDGILPALCALCGIKILSTSFSSSAVCFDKNWTKNIMSASGILVPKGIVLDLNDKKSHESVRSFFKECNSKIIMKPATCGASRGCTVCTDEGQISEGIEKVSTFSDQVLCEEFIEGKEYTIGLLHYKGELRILPPVEIITSRNFFDYQAKYEDAQTKEICPAETLKAEKLDEVHTIIKTLVKVLKIESHARVDFIVSEGKVFVLEVNTFPGLMDNSLFPKELKAAGISMRDFIANAFSK
jgi:D-alanine-D-alanine ligase